MHDCGHIGHDIIQYNTLAQSHHQKESPLILMARDKAMEPSTALRVVASPENGTLSSHYHGNGTGPLAARASKRRRLRAD